MFSRTDITPSPFRSRQTYPDYFQRACSSGSTFPLNEENLAACGRENRESNQEAFFQNTNVAAIIIEAIQGEGGDNHFRSEFFRTLRQLADENDAMLIIDEVQTGVAMTGKMWAHQHSVEPDMIAFGKKMQVCGFLCGRRIEEIKENVFAVPSRINSTWGGNLGHGPGAAVSRDHRRGILSGMPEWSGASGEAS
jgi:L-lysine 6-transaminase